jgi:MFS-type transporter involved in bile tolerance (Atg22 family)
MTEIPECEGRVLGIKPSSILTTYTMIVGISSSAILPLMGAIIDYTPWRLSCGQITSLLFILTSIPQIFLNEQNFRILAIIQLLNSFIGWTQTELAYTYLPELSENEDVLNDYTKSFTVAFFSSSVIYLVVIIGSVTAAGYGDNDLLISRTGIAVAVVINIVLLPLAWKILFKKREQMHELPNNTSIWTAGFIQLYHTTKGIASNFNALKWFFVAIALSDAAIQAMTTIMVTYMTDKLQFTTTENGVSIGITLCGT